MAPTDQIDALEPALARVNDHLDWMTNLVGRYPFHTYGSFFSDATFPFALEDQTISLYPAFLFLPPFPAAIYEPIMVHELAHQWFGDSVPPARWSDVRLNEGHATWYERSYGAQFFGRDFEPTVRAAYVAGDQLRALYGPVALPKHGANDILGMGEGLVGKVWATGQPRAVSQLKHHPWFKPRPGCENETYLCVPIGKPGGPDGVLAVGSDAGFDVRSGDLGLLHAYAELLALAMPPAPRR